MKDSHKTADLVNPNPESALGSTRRADTETIRRREFIDRMTAEIGKIDPSKGIREVFDTIQPILADVNHELGMDMKLGDFFSTVREVDSGSGQLVATSQRTLLPDEKLLELLLQHVESGKSYTTILGNNQILLIETPEWQRIRLDENGNVVQNFFFPRLADFANITQTFFEENTKKFYQEICGDQPGLLSDAALELLRNATQEVFDQNYLGVGSSRGRGLMTLPPTERDVLATGISQSRISPFRLTEPRSQTLSDPNCLSLAQDGGIVSSIATASEAGGILAYTYGEGMVFSIDATNVNTFFHELFHSFNNHIDNYPLLVRHIAALNRFGITASYFTTYHGDGVAEGHDPLDNNSLPFLDVLRSKIAAATYYTKGRDNYENLRQCFQDAHFPQKSIEEQIADRIEKIFERESVLRNATEVCLGIASSTAPAPSSTSTPVKTSPIALATNSTTATSTNDQVPTSPVFEQVEPETTPQSLSSNSPMSFDSALMITILVSNLLEIELPAQAAEFGARCFMQPDHSTEATAQNIGSAARIAATLVFRGAAAAGTSLAFTGLARIANSPGFAQSLGFENSFLENVSDAVSAAVPGRLKDAYNNTDPRLKAFAGNLAFLTIYYTMSDLLSKPFFKDSIEDFLPSEGQQEPASHIKESIVAALILSAASSALNSMSNFLAPCIRSVFGPEIQRNETDLENSPRQADQASFAVTQVIDVGTPSTPSNFDQNPPSRDGREIQAIEPSPSANAPSRFPSPEVSPEQHRLLSQTSISPHGAFSSPSDTENFGAVAEFTEWRNLPIDNSPSSNSSAPISQEAGRSQNNGATNYSPSLRTNEISGATEISDPAHHFSFSDDSCGGIQELNTSENANTNQLARVSNEQNGSNLVGEIFSVSSQIGFVNADGRPRKDPSLAPSGQTQPPLEARLANWDNATSAYSDHRPIEAVADLVCTQSIGSVSVGVRIDEPSSQPHPTSQTDNSAGRNIRGR